MNTYYTKEERGQGALLFLHGWGCDGSIFGSVAGNVKATSYMIDMWGFGKSDSPPMEGWTVEQYADTLYGWILEMNLPPLTIVGHSFGGRVAVVLASKYPQLVTNLVLVGSAGLRRFSIVRLLKVARYKANKWLVRHGIMSKATIANAGSVDYQNANDIMHNTFVKVVTQDLSHYAKTITAPTLLVWGDNDRDTPLWMAYRYNNIIADSHLVILQGDHFVMLQQSKVLANMINSLMEG